MPLHQAVSRNTQRIEALEAENKELKARVKKLEEKPANKVQKMGPLNKKFQEGVKKGKETWDEKKEEEILAEKALEYIDEEIKK